MKKSVLAFLLCIVGIMTHAQTKAPVFLYAGQSNADGRDYVNTMPDYMKVGSSPYAPYTHLQWASICGNPSKTSFGTRTLKNGERYAFCDVTNYWIDQAVSSNFYAIKCAYGGTAIATGVTKASLPVWYADATWMTTHNAYQGQDITQAEYANNNSLTKNLTEGFGSLADAVLSKLDDGYEVKAIMWHQGESDRSSAAAAAYQTNFATMIAYMRQAIYDKTGDEKALTLPFIFGTVPHNSTQYSATVEAAQRAVAAADANVHLIDMSNATLRSDNLHFDAQATDYLGKKMYNKLVELELVSGEQEKVEEFPVVASPMDDATQYDNHSWNILPISDATVTALAADGTNWNLNDGNYRRTNSVSTDQLLYSSDTAVTETAGLYFSAAKGNRICLNTTYGLVFVGGEVTVYIPKLKSGQLISFTARRGTKNTATICPVSGMEDYVELLSNTAELTTDYQTITFRMKYNFAGTKHVGFTTSGSANSYYSKIEVKTPETVTVNIGADRKETFSSDKALDFSPFTDLFKAYVVTGYDDGTGIVDCEQVLQAPANTGLLLMGEECQVDVPVVEGDAPVISATNLLTAVVGDGNAPANSFVLTTSGGVTSFTKSATTVALNNQAYLASLGSLSSYGFNPMEAKTEHVYDLSTGLLAKGTKLRMTSTPHHSMTVDDKTVDLYQPENAVPLDGRFVFDNSGKWRMLDSKWRLGYSTNGNTLYASVISLANGDRVKFEFTGTTAADVSLYAVNDVLRGVSAGGTLTSGTTYTVVAAEGETVNLDLKMASSTNSFGFTSMTVWSSTVTEPIYPCTKPEHSARLQQIREGLYKPVLTLSSTNRDDAAITYYYKGGSVVDWTALAGNTFEPAENAEYTFKATATGFGESDPLTLSIGHRYGKSSTIDLTTDASYEAATKSNDGYAWTGWGLSGDQVYGKLTSSSFCGLTVRNNSMDKRYSFAKGIGLAVNYDNYTVNVSAATTYQIAEYELYQNKSVSDITTRQVLYNGENVNTILPTFSSGGALRAVNIYEPVDVETINLQDEGFFTFSSTSALDFTGSSIHAYIAKYTSGDAVTLHEVTKVPANTGLLVKGATGNNDVLTTEESTDDVSGNVLVAQTATGTVYQTTDDKTNYVLGLVGETPTFLKVPTSGVEIAASKAYLSINYSAAAARLNIVMDDELTGIGATLNGYGVKIGDKAFYNLNGQRISKPTKGMYILNGKKVFIK